jgi:hypothetical protein
MVDPAAWFMCTLSIAQGLRHVTKEEGALLCFDEVMTGFRIAKGGAQVHASAGAAGCACAARPAGTAARSSFSTWRRLT